MFFLDMSDITAWVLGALRGIAAWLCSFIYELIAGVYELLFAVSRVRLLNQSVCMNVANTEQILQYQGADITTKAMCDAAGGIFTPSTITLVYQRVTLLLAIIMVFYVTFQFVKYLFTPEDMGDKEKGVEKLGFKLLTIVALLALVPTIFDKVYDLQEIVLKNQFLAKIVLGTKVENTDEFGRQFAANYLKNFYYFEPIFASASPPNEDGSLPESTAECDGIPCNYLVMRTLARFRQDGKLDMLTYGMSSHGKLNEQSDTFYIHFDALIALVTGVLILWMLIMYTIDVGMRVIQLTFLQVIAPIPIIAYLSPKKDGTFQKWVKQCTTTYLDLFLRLSIIYFVMLLIQSINQSFTNGTLLQNIPDADDTLKLFVYIVLILGLMRFCQKVPKLIEELFPSMGTSMGTFGLKPGERIPQAARRIAGAAVAGAAGAGIGLAQGFRQGMRASAQGKNGFTKFLKGAAGSIQGAGRGVTGGLARGMYNGAKKGNMIKNIGAGIKSGTASNKNFGNRLESGYKFRHQAQDRVSGFMGTPDRKERLEKQKRSKEGVIKERDAEKSYRKSVGDKSFENAVTKGKGSKDSNVRGAVENYNKLDQREKDLMSSDSATRAMYKKGQVKQDKNSIANYEAAKRNRDSALANANSQTHLNDIKSKVTMDGASLGVKQTDYVKEKEVFDDKAFEEEKKKNPNKHMKSSGFKDKNGAEIMVVDEEAWEKDKANYTKKTKEFDQEAYDKAVDDARTAKAEEYRDNEIKGLESYYHKELNKYVYASDDEADETLARELNDVRIKKKDAKDKVSFAYEDWATRVDASGEANDKEIYDMKHAREEENRLFNDSNMPDNRVSRDAEIYDKAAELIASRDGIDVSSVTRDMVDKEFARTDAGKITRAEVEDKWIKSTVAEKRREVQDFVREVDTKIQNIKDETDGSGIPGGKK